MTIAATAKRRRRQASNGYIHVARIGRPIIRKKSILRLQRHLADVIARERQMSAGKSKKK